jgi:hypothetical protein
MFREKIWNIFCGHTRLLVITAYELRGVSDNLSTGFFSPNSSSQEGIVGSYRAFLTEPNDVYLNRNDESARVPRKLINQSGSCSF